MTSDLEVDMADRLLEHMDFLTSLGARIMTLDDYGAPRVLAILRFAFAVGYIAAANDKLGKREALPEDSETHYLHMLMTDDKLWGEIARSRQKRSQELEAFAMLVRPGEDDPSLVIGTL